MNSYLIFSVGFLAQLLFSARQLTQWIASEKAKQILSPLFFWQLSILGSLLLMLYGVLRHDLAIILGQTITYGVYIRNLQFHGFWPKIPLLFRVFAFLFPALGVIWLLLGETYNFNNIISNEDIPPYLMVWGILGQFVFTFRFVYQWLCSERRKLSILPMGFWFISISGSLMVLSYAIIRKDPVLFVGQLFGCLVYGRNILIGLRYKRSQ